MARMALNEAAKPLALQLGRLIISQIPRRAPYDANALGLCYFVRDWIRYTHESPETFADLANLVLYPAGDCDDMSIALAALLVRMGYPARHVAFRVGYRRGRGVHVWVSVYSPRVSRWIELDPSTWKLEPGQSPAPRFEHTTTHPLTGGTHVHSPTNR